MNKIKVGDILHFKDYVFTDNNTKTNHFALVILPQVLFCNSIHCAVITKNLPRRKLYIELDCKTYPCFSVLSYSCLDRIDIEYIERGNHSFRASLTLKDIRKALKIIHICIRINHKCYLDKLFIATLLREWKKHRDALVSAPIGS